MGKIFGGSKSKSTSSSSNRSYDQLNTTLSPLVNQSVQANDLLQRFLGGDSSGFNSFKENTGFNWEAMRGIEGIGADSASRGVFRSGARDKAIQEFGANLSNRSAQQYINSLLGIGGQGLQAGNIIAGAGQTSTGTSTSSSSPNLGGLIGAGIGAFAKSDRAAKKDINQIGNYGNIGLYTFRYLEDSEDQDVRVGVMADEVSKEYPEALGPKTDDGFDTVNYTKLAELVEEKD